MKAVLVNGPNNGKEVDVAPGTLEHLVALPKPIDVLYPFDHVDVAQATAYYDVAIYRFQGIGFVDLDGNCTALIFHYVRTVAG